MLRLLGFPDFAQSLIADFVFSNLSDLRVKIFKLLPLCVRWNLDRALFRNERDLIVSIFVRRAVKDGTDTCTDRHVIRSPRWFEKTAVTVHYSAIGEADQN